MAVKPDDTRLAPERPRLSVVEDGARPEPRRDARLVEALRAERPEAFDELVGSYQNAVCNLAYRLVRDREEARDVAQDVFLKAYRRIPQIEGELHLWAWLRRVTVNTCWDHLRAASRRPMPSEDAEELAGAVPGDEGERREMARLFSDSLARLTPRQQAALVLKDVHGFTHNDIADALGISRASSEILLFRARHSFRRAYSALAAEEQQAHVCRYAERAAAAAVGGRLSSAQRQRVLEHARACGHCSDVVATWRRDRHAGLALVFPFVAAPHLLGAHAGLTAVAGAGIAGAKTGVAAGGSAAGGGAAGGSAAGGTAAASSAGVVSSAAAAAGAPLLSAGASSGAALGAAGLSAKLAGLGVVKIAAVALAAASVATYGGVQTGKMLPDAPARVSPAVAAVSSSPAAPQQAVATTAPQSAAGAAAAPAETQTTSRLHLRLRLLRRAAALTGDPRLAGDVDQLGLVLAAGGGLAGADTLREWNRVTRAAMRMLRGIGGWGSAGPDAPDGLASLVRGAQARLRLARPQGAVAQTARPAPADGGVAVARAAGSSSTHVAAPGSTSGGAQADEAPPSAVDPSSELGGVRVTTPDKGGVVDDAAGSAPKKPVAPVSPVKPRSGTTVE